MTRCRFLYVAVLAASLGAATACGSATPTTPTPTTPVTFTEVFTGTLTPNGATNHSFIAQSSGTVTLTLTTVAPDSAVAIGIALGTWTGSACQIVIANDRALQGAVLNGAVGQAGSLCVRAYDAAGSLAAGTAVSYEFTVVHP